MPRFVLLYHDCPACYERASHWDFMLESGDVLRTWALERLPRDWEAAFTRTSAVYPNCASLAADNGVAATELGDHRRDYLELEGTLRGDRGTVVRVAAGTYQSEHESPEVWRVELSSHGIAAHVSLTRSVADGDRWVLRGS